MANPGTIDINGEPYAIVDESRMRTGRRAYVEGYRPSQPSDPAQIKSARWALSGPIGQSRERADGFLGHDYSDNLDTRYSGLLTSTAKRTALTLTTIGGTAQFAVPISDVSKTDWSEGAGDADADAFDELDEGVASATPDDDTSYWETSTESALITCGITSLTDPGNDDPITMRVRAKFPSGDRIAFALQQSTTNIYYAIEADDGTGDWATYTLTVPSSAVAQITDWTALRMFAQYYERNGAGTLQLSGMELQVGASDAGNVITIDEDRGQVFAQRGAYSTQINPATMLEVENEDHARRVSDSVASWDGAGFVAFGSAGLVKKRTAVDANSGSTYADVTSVQAYKMAVGSDRLWIVDAAGGSDDGKGRYVIAGNDLTSANLSNSVPLADAAAGFITSLSRLGPYMIAGTQRGPMSFTDAGTPQSLGEGVSGFPATENGASADSAWGWNYQATKLGLFAVDPQTLVENPVGPGEGMDGQNFEGPIDGFPTAVRRIKDSLFCAYLNPDGTTYIFRGVFGPQTAATGRPQWYPFQKITSAECHAIGMTTGRALPTIIWGEDDNVGWSELAFRGREIAASGYTFSTSGGTWFGSSLMRSPGMHKTIRYATILTENCDASNTWQLAISVDEGSYIDVGSAVQADGHQILRPVSGGVPLTTLSGHTFKPRLTQVAASDTSPPQIRGDLEIYWDERPDRVREVSVVVEWKQAGDLAELQTLLNEHDNPTPVAIRLPTQTDVNTNLYGYVIDAQAEDLKDPTDRGIRLSILEWATS